MKAIVSEKGQVTIPKLLRERMGIRSGDVLEFSEERGGLLARKALERDPVDAVYGTLKLDRSVDEMIDEMRGGPADP